MVPVKLLCGHSIVQWCIKKPPPEHCWRVIVGYDWNTKCIKEVMKSQWTLMEMLWRSEMINEFSMRHPLPCFNTLSSRYITAALPIQSIGPVPFKPHPGRQKADEEIQNWRFSFFCCTLEETNPSVCVCVFLCVDGCRANAEQYGSCSSQSSLTPPTPSSLSFYRSSTDLTPPPPSSLVPHWFSFRGAGLTSL